MNPWLESKPLNISVDEYLFIIINSNNNKFWTILFYIAFSENATIM